VIQEALRDWVGLVGEGRSGRGSAVLDGRKTTINVTESQGDATLVGIDDILERCL
jgi:hypothetical protein